MVVACGLMNKQGRSRPAPLTRGDSAEDVFNFLAHSLFLKNVADGFEHCKPDEAREENSDKTGKENQNPKTDGNIFSHDLHALFFGHDCVVIGG